MIYSLYCHADVFLSKLLLKNIRISRVCGHEGNNISTLSSNHTLRTFLNNNIYYRYFSKGVGALRPGFGQRK